LAVFNVRTNTVSPFFSIRSISVNNGSVFRAVCELYLGIYVYVKATFVINIVS